MPEALFICMQKKPKVGKCKKRYKRLGIKYVKG